MCACVSRGTGIEKGEQKHHSTQHAELVSCLPQVVKYIEHSGLLNYRGGTPASFNNSGEQWDFPNCWAPVQALIIQGLENTGQPDARILADDLARRWLHANYLGFQDSEMMYEKVRKSSLRAGLPDTRSVLRGYSSSSMTT